MSIPAVETKRVLATLYYEHQIEVEVKPEDNAETIEIKLLDKAKNIRTVGPGSLRDWKWEAIPDSL